MSCENMCRNAGWVFRGGAWRLRTLKLLFGAQSRCHPVSHIFGRSKRVREGNQRGVSVGRMEAGSKHSRDGPGHLQRSGLGEIP